jgi:hypothetical protein
MKNGGLVHDVLLVRSDGSKRIFRIYGRPLPESGETITLPVDGRSIMARVSLSRRMRKWSSGQMPRRLN